MTERDETQAFLQSLPELKSGESFRFACHPEVQCFNACCGDLTLMLTPYDVLRLRKALGQGSREFVTQSCEVLAAPDTGMPSLRLRMMEGHGRPCPFVTSKGCSVYPHRPAACRTYPLGRATKLAEDGGLLEQFFVVKEPHCKGFKENQDWTSETWLKDQGLEPYNEANDRYMRLLARVKRRGAPVDPRHANMAVLALYQPDSFMSFARDMKIMDRLDISAERAEAALADEEAALDFALEWLELIIFGDSPSLSPKKRQDAHGE